MDPTVKISIAVVGVLLLGTIIYFATSTSSSPSSSSKSAGQSLNLGGGSGGGRSTKNKQKSTPAPPPFTLPDTEIVTFSGPVVPPPTPAKLKKGITFQLHGEHSEPSSTLFTYTEGEIRWDVGGLVFTQSGSRDSTIPNVFAVCANDDGGLLLAQLPTESSTGKGTLSLKSASDNTLTNSEDIEPEMLYGRLYQKSLASPVSIDTMTVKYNKQTYVVTLDYLKNLKIEDFPLTALNTAKPNSSAVNAYASIKMIIDTPIEDSDEEGKLQVSVDASSAEDPTPESETHKSFTGRSGTLIVALHDDNNQVTLTYTPHVKTELSETPPNVAKVKNFSPINGNTLQSINGFWCDAQGCWLVYTKHTRGAQASLSDLYVHIFHIVEDTAQNKSTIHASSQKVHDSFTPLEFRYSHGLQQPYLKTTGDNTILLYVNKTACGTTNSTWTQISTAVWNGVKSLVRSMPGALHAYGPYIAGMALGAAETLYPAMGNQIGNSLSMIIGFINPTLGAQMAAGKHGFTSGLDMWNSLGKMAFTKLQAVNPGTKLNTFTEIQTNASNEMDNEWLNLIDTFSHYPYIEKNGSAAEKAIVQDYNVELAKVKTLRDNATTDTTKNAAIAAIRALRLKRDAFDAKLFAAKGDKRVAAHILNIKIKEKTSSKVGSLRSQVSLLAEMQSLTQQWRALRSSVSDVTKVSEVDAAEGTYSRAVIKAWTAYSTATRNEKAGKEKGLQDTLKKHQEVLELTKKKLFTKKEHYTSSPGITYLEEQMAAVNTTLSSHERMLDSVKSRVDTQSTQLHTTQQDVVALKSKVEEIERKRQAYHQSVQAPLNSFLYF